MKWAYDIVDARASGDVAPEDLLSVSIHRGVVPRASMTDDVPRAEDLSNYKVVCRGDLVINRMRAFQGAVGLAKSDGVVSPDYLVLRPKPQVERRYLHHLFRSDWFVGQMIARLRGIGSTEQGNVRTPRINAEDLGEIDAPSVHIDDQRAIADYLDTETTRIDALITKKRRMIELLDERGRLAVSATLWESSWPEVRLKYLCGLPTSGNRDHGSFTPDDTGVPCLRGLNVRPGRLDLHNLLKISHADHFRLWATHLDPGDLVIVRSGLAGSAAVIPEDFGPCNCVDVVVVRRADAIAPRLLEYLVNSCEAQEQVTRHSAGALLTHFNAVDAGNLALPVPPLEVQPSILADLEKSSAHFSQITAALERQISLLAEHRQALITAAVTGELEIPVAA